MHLSTDRSIKLQYTVGSPTSFLMGGGGPVGWRSQGLGLCEIETSVNERFPIYPRGAAAGIPWTATQVLVLCNFFRGICCIRTSLG